MRKFIVVLFLIALAVAGGWYYRQYIQSKDIAHELVLFGNVDDRQVQLSFSYAERIAELIPEEGTRVAKGDCLGSLETIRIEKERDAVLADIAARKTAIETAQAVVVRMKSGYRSEDITTVQSIKKAIEAKLVAAASQDKRQKTLLNSNSTSVVNQENAVAEHFFLSALRDACDSVLSRLRSGERLEDIKISEAKVKQAEADLARSQAQLAILDQKLKDAKLYAPCDGIIRSRLMEPGEMTTAQKHVLTLAVVSPKWIRCYLTESHLTKVKSGDHAVVHFDGSDKDFEGWVGFISPNAEFTPKNIETEDLRTNLVYEVRVFVKDPENLLKLGGPATVRFPGVLVK